MPIRTIRLHLDNWSALRALPYADLERWAIRELWSRSDELGAVARLDSLKIDLNSQDIVLTYLALGGTAPRPVRKVGRTSGPAAIEKPA